MPEQTTGAGGSVPGASGGGGGLGAAGVGGDSGSSGGGSGAFGGGADGSGGGSGGSSGGAPDFFDRLVARHVPGAGTPGGVVRVRPRLPGPFERVEAVRGDADDPWAEEEPAALWPATSDPAPRPGEGGRGLHEIRTEHERTVLHTERAADHETAEAGAPRPGSTESGLLRPAATPAPHSPRPAEPGRRGTGRAEPEPAAGPTAPSLLPATSAAPPAAPTGARPLAAPADPASAARGAAAGRRGSRGGERVVHVQIGRLEVSAAGAGPGAGRTAPAPAPARQAPAVSLADYLAGRGSDGEARR